jgi:hypothetical protein
MTTTAAEARQLVVEIESSKSQMNSERGQIADNDAVHPYHYYHHQNQHQRQQRQLARLLLMLPKKTGTTVTATIYEAITTLRVTTTTVKVTTLHFATTTLTKNVTNLGRYLRGLLCLPSGYHVC